MMNSNFSKKLLAVVLTTLFMVSMGASAAEKKCKKGKHMNPVTNKCMTDDKK